MQIRLFLFFLWLLLPLSSLQAQKVLVCDGATRFPIRDVLVSVDGKNVGLTTWQGIINLPDSFQTASFKKKGYAPEKLFRSEVLRDTVFLFPAEHYLDEVVVIGKQVIDGRELLKKMVIVIAPFAPHMAEELWEQLGGETKSVFDAEWPAWDESYLVENEVQLTVSFNGKARFQMTFPADATKEDIEKKALEDERSQHYIDGKTIVKIIVVPKKIINIVCK